MLQYEDITKVQEIKGKFKKVWLSSEYLNSHLNILGFNKITKQFDWCKKSGYTFKDLISILLILPIIGISSVFSLSKNKDADINNCGKDSYYRLLSNQNIDWRSFLFQFVMQYLLKEELFTPEKDATKCLIFDDSDLAKTGKTIEGVSKIYNHVSKSFYLGYKILVAGYWNGSVFIPVDFSLHRESKKSKLKYGLTAKQRQAQKKTPRCSKTVAAKRYLELNKKKTDVLVQMFSRVIKRKITVDYILTDTWFTSISLLKKLRSICGKTHIIGMYKYNSKIEVQSRIKTISQLKKQDKKPKRCRKFNYYYHSYVTNIEGLGVEVFISRRGINGKWHTLITTDTSLKFVKVIEIYSIRWSIEVFFKEAKQLFGLGKAQSTNFDIQIAQTTIVFIQYLLISIRYRMEAYETIGGLFKDLQQDYIENKLNVRLLAVVALILDVLEKLVESIDIHDITTKIIDNIESFGLLSNNYHFKYQATT
ncbi:Transposase [Myroides sp. A21]|uniref:IS4 family transposase n=1 Tax=Myroides sp. A21 TaxID=1583100 RepID=UPI00057E92A3|nr:transposase [Myroides sp. A21]AJA69231.1 Transposase [Myroides sp. A21]AJA70307.1 Transposase [Myroides sp. A21]